MDREAGQLYDLAKAVITPAFKFAFRVETSGLDNVPEHGPAVLCPNHISFIDSLFLPSVLSRRITYVGKAEYLDSWKTRYIFPALGMIPIDRKGGDSATAALDAASRVLERGELFGIYPEGTRSRDARYLHRGHTGAARLALRNKCPIIPVGIVGTEKVQPPDTSFPRIFMTVQLKMGRPISVDRYEGRESDRLVLRQLIDEVMYEIREMTGQEYVDSYATKKSETLPTARTTVMTAGARGLVGVSTGSAPGGNGSGDDAEPPPPRSSAEVLRGRATR